MGGRREGGEKYTDENMDLNSLSGKQGRHLSYQRGKRNTNPNTSLIKIEGADTQEHANFYCGKFSPLLPKPSPKRLPLNIRRPWRIWNGVLMVFAGI